MSIVETSLMKAKATQKGGAERPAAGSSPQTAPASRPAQPAVAPDAPLHLDVRGPRLTLNLEHLRSLGIYPPDEGLRRRAYEYRTLKYSLTRSSAPDEDGTQHPSRFIAVSSALPRDGKTCTSFNLALSFARGDDRPVILVDADLAKRHLSEALGATDRPGLANLIQDPKLDVLDLLMPTDIPTFSFLPAGISGANSAELLGSSRLAQAIQQLTQLHPNHVIVFDTSPLLLTNEASLLAPLVEHVLLVVRAGVTLQDAAKEALARVQGLAPVSVVLNAWQPVGLSEKDYYQRYRDYYGQ